MKKSAFAHAAHSRMGKFLTGLILAVTAIVGVAEARPYPALSGGAAAADSPATAGSNPAGLTRFDERNFSIELIVLDSESTWEGSLGAGATRRTQDSSTTLVPSGAIVVPLNEDWVFGFTLLGAALSEDFGDDWPGRYFIQEYESLLVNAFPSLAWRANDHLSLGVGIGIGYSSFEQSRAVPNTVLDGIGYEPADGKMKYESDDIAFSFGLSALYEFTEKTRVGLVYSSENDNTMSGNAKFSDLGPNTESFFDNAGLLNASVDNSSTWPQSLSGGLFHEFDNRSAVTLDVSWIDFSEFVLTETYINDDLILEHSIDYDDIWTVGGSYSWPLNEKWMLAAGILRVSDMVSDSERSMILRLDDAWVYGLGLEYFWKPNRKILVTIDYIDVGDAPVTTPSGTSGSVGGRYTDRDIYLFRIAMEFGNGPR